MTSEATDNTQPPEHKPRVAIFVESHEGYGHFNITAQLIKQLEERGAEVMVLSGTLNYAGAAQTFNMRDSRIVHLPLVDYRPRGGIWEWVTPEGTLYEESPDHIEQRKKMVSSALDNFKPDLVLTELYPFLMKFRNHDLEALSELKKTGIINPEVCSLCRDIIHNSQPQRVLDSLDKHFDRIFVRGDSRFSRLSESQPEWENIKTPVEYMGNYITNMPPRDETIPDDQRHVVIFGGGGYYDYDMPFFENLIRSRAESKKFGDRFWDIYVSENARKHFVNDPDDLSGERKISAFEYIERLAAKEGHGMIRVFPPIDSRKFREELANSAVAITRGGYNTTFELFAANQTQLVIPRLDKEQIQRANRLYLKGIAQVFPEHPITDATLKAMKVGSDVKSLAEAIDITPEIHASVPEFNNHGAEHTADRIIELCQQRTTGPVKLTPGTDVHDASAALALDNAKGAVRD